MGRSSINSSCWESSWLDCRNTWLKCKRSVDGVQGCAKSSPKIVIQGRLPCRRLWGANASWRTDKTHLHRKRRSRRTHHSSRSLSVYPERVVATCCSAPTWLQHRWPQCTECPTQFSALLLTHSAHASANHLNSGWHRRFARRTSPLPLQCVCPLPGFGARA